MSLLTKQQTGKIQHIHRASSHHHYQWQQEGMVTHSVSVCVVLIKAEIKSMWRAIGTYLASTSVDTLPGTFLRISSPKLTKSLSIVFATCSSSVLKNKTHIMKLVNLRFKLHCKVIFTESVICLSCLSLCFQPKQGLDCLRGVSLQSLAVNQ